VNETITLATNGHLLVGVDIETTGTSPGYHEIIQLSLIPLTPSLQRDESRSVFDEYITPSYPHRIDPRATPVHGLSCEFLQEHGNPIHKVIDWLVDWLEMQELPVGRRLIPIAHNWRFEDNFLTQAMGDGLRGSMFHPHVRDSLRAATMLRDAFPWLDMWEDLHSLSLSSLCNRLKIANKKPHNSLYDAEATVQLYQRLMQIMRCENN